MPAKSHRLPLAPMTIAFYIPSKAKKLSGNFIVETFFPLFEPGTGHKLILITDGKMDLPFDPGKTGMVMIKPGPHNRLLKKLWIERTLMSVIKKNNADIVISADGSCSLKTSLPQVILAPDPEKIRPVYAKKARALLVLSGAEK